MNDSGFVLLDALAATAIAALAGGAALAALTAVLANQHALIERSLETTNIDSFVQTIVLDWREATNRTWNDGVFRYQAMETPNSEGAVGLVRVRVQSIDAQDRIVSDFEIWVPR